MHGIDINSTCVLLEFSKPSKIFIEVKVYIIKFLKRNMKCISTSLLGCHCLNICMLHAQYIYIANKCASIRSISKDPLDFSNGTGGRIPYNTRNILLSNTCIHHDKLVQTSKFYGIPPGTQPDVLVLLQIVALST